MAAPVVYDETIPDINGFSLSRRGYMLRAEKDGKVFERKLPTTVKPALEHLLVDMHAAGGLSITVFDGYPTVRLSFVFNTVRLTLARVQQAA
jgi:hypothetical protein